MICDLKNIENYDMLNCNLKLNTLLKNICQKYNFQILNEITYNFKPIGTTILFLLSESHISIHTFPEKHHLSFDIYTCRQYKDNKDYQDIYNFLIDNLNASKENSVCTIIDRFF